MRSTHSIICGTVDYKVSTGLFPWKQILFLKVVYKLVVRIGAYIPVVTFDLDNASRNANWGCTTAFFRILYIVILQYHIKW